MTEEWVAFTKGRWYDHDGRQGRIRVPWPTEALPPRRTFHRYYKTVTGRLQWRGKKLVVPGLGEVSIIKKEFMDLEVDINSPKEK